MKTTNLSTATILSALGAEKRGAGCADQPIGRRNFYVCIANAVATVIILVVTVRIYGWGRQPTIGEHLVAREHS
jgi:hypothetical protein